MNNPFFLITKKNLTEWFIIMVCTKVIDVIPQKNNLMNISLQEPIK